MLTALLITFRETLEASLVIGIILAYLKKSGNQRHYKYIWWAITCGILTSIIFAYLFNTLVGGFEGHAEQIYEGVTMLTAAALISWMIIWMLKQRSNLRQNIENKAEMHINQDHPLGLFFLVFVSVIREGIETVIFLQAASLQSGQSNLLLGGITGIIMAIVLSFLLFKGFAKVPLRKFFTITSAMLILFAAGLVAHGVHELEEAGLVPIIIEHLWDINPSISTEGEFPALHEKGSIGSILVGLFGYNGNPSLVEVLSYFVYLLLIAGSWRIISKKNT